MAKIKPEVKAEAAKIFEANPNIKTLFVNDKDEFFTTKNFARNSVSKEEDITEILRDSVIADDSADTDTAKTADRPNLKTTVDAIKAVTTIEGLEAYKADERQGVKDAVAKRLKELEPAGTGTGTEGGNAGTGTAPEGTEPANTK